MERVGVLDLYAWEAIDWDDPDDEDGNLVHCLAHGVDEDVVDGILASHPVEVKMNLISAEFAVVGPERSWSAMWTILFATSYKRGDWLRPVTGWQAKPGEIAQWEAATQMTWSGRR